MSRAHIFLILTCYFERQILINIRTLMKLVMLHLLLLFSFLNLSGQVVLERDINEEAASSKPFCFVELDDILYFKADDGIHGEELYSYNTLTETASLVANLKPLNESARIDEVVVLDKIVYFNGQVGSSSAEYLLFHNPNTNETGRLFDQEGESARDPKNIFKYNGKLYFSADFGSQGKELGRYDPESIEVEILADINPGLGDSEPWSFVEVNGELWFLAKDESQTNKLWKYNFTTNTPEEITYGSENGLFPSLGQLHYFENKLVFNGFLQGMGSELWILDVASSTLLDFPEIYPGPASSRPSSYVNHNGKLYFSATNLADRRELRVYDPLTNEATLLADINENGDSNPSDILIIKDKLYFAASTDDIQRKLFTFDTQNAILKEEASLDNNGFQNYLSTLIVADDVLYLSGQSPQVGTELLKFKPGNSEIEIAADINQTTIGSSPYQFTEYGGKLYFGADEINTGREVWVYDPTTGNVDILSDLPGNTAPYNFTVLEEKLYFSGVYPVLGYGLLYYDVATGEISPTTYITPNSTGHITDITAYNGKLYFKASDELLGNELHVFDPISNSVQIVVDLLPGEDDGSPERFFVFENELFFQASDGTSGLELWKYNASTDETSLVSDINPGNGDSYPENFSIFNGKLFFSAYENDSSTELYSYDPATGEVIRRTDVSGNMDPSYLTVYKDRLFMKGKMANSSNHELIYFDDASGELILAADIDPGSGSGSPRDLVVFNDKLYFSAETDEYGREIWEYNDTIASIVADIYPGIPGSDASELTIFNGKLYFSANDGIRGAELWSIAECLNVFVDTEPNMGTASGGFIDLTIQGGLPPYNITWSNGESSEDLGNLEPGIYTAVITDDSGCLSEITAEITQLIDQDMDGFEESEDCDDNNAAINPDADEIANNDIDEDCDGIALVIDEDMDGFNSDEDCNDTNPAINPDADEIANNGIDENCDGEDLVSSVYDEQRARVNIYPNPFNSTLIIENNVKKWKWKIFSADGKIISDGKSIQETEYINTSDWQHGLYFLQITSLNSVNPSPYKVVKN